MDTLDRYLVREFFIFFGLIAISLALLFLGIDFISKLATMKLPMAKILQIYVYKFPAALQQFLPVACLMSSLLLFTSMSRQNEILALHSSGVGTLRIVSTLVAAIALISTVSFLVFDNIVPMLHKRQILVSQGLDTTQEHLSNFVHGSFWLRSDSLIYNVGRFVPADNRLENIDIYRLAPPSGLSEKIHAKRAQYVGEDWLLEDGYIIHYPRESAFPRFEAFKSLTGVIREKPTDFRTLKIQEDTMRLRDLRKFIGKHKAGGLDTTGQQVNYHERIAFVFTPLVFILISVPFALKPLKSASMGRSVGFCFLVVFLYLLAFRTSISVGRGAHIPPIVAAWGPNVLFLLVSVFFITRRPR